jgi:hypothetical protein
MGQLTGRVRYPKFSGLVRVSCFQPLPKPEQIGLLTHTQTKKTRKTRKTRQSSFSGFETQFFLVLWVWIRIENPAFSGFVDVET